MISEPCKPAKLNLGDNVKRVNMGNKPNNTFLFIADASYSKDRGEMNQFYENVNSKYPKVEVIYAFPLNQKLDYFE